MMVRFIACLGLGAAACAQTICPPTPQFSPCEIVFELPAANGDQTLDLEAQFRSPHQNTGIAKAFWDGGSRWVIRYTPSEPGSYAYRIASRRLAEFNGKEGQIVSTPAERPGWVRAANVHHFAYVDEANNNSLSPHLWMGAVVAGFASFSSMDAAQWRALVDARALQHFNHLGVTLVDEGSASRFQSPEFFRAAEEKIRYANQKGIIVDLAFFGPDGLLNRLLPAREDRQKWFTYALSRLAAFDVTWQGIEGWESYDNGRDLLKEIGDYLAMLDPYKRTRSTRTSMSSGALADDGWLRYRSYQTGDDAVTAIEQQIYQYPAVNNFGAGVTDADTFRHRLWNATMSGQYPSAAIPNEQAANEMKIWYEFMKETRHWELEPFFDVENGRGLALEGTEYIIYVEKPGPVTVTAEDHSYDGRWFNPATGMSVKIKEIKNGMFTGEPPDRTHDWVLQISREGRKASMLRSYKFDSRVGGIVMQEIEGNPEKVPFTVVEPSGAELSLAQPAAYAIKLTRETKALQRTMYEWTGEVTLSDRGPRVIGIGPGGTFHIPANIARDYPAALHVRITGMNGLGKVYTLDRNYTLHP
jgi:hypothetical protein